MVVLSTSPQEVSLGMSFHFCGLSISVTCFQRLVFVRASASVLSRMGRWLIPTTGEGQILCHITDFKGRTEIDPDGKDPGELHIDNEARFTHKFDDEKEAA